MAAAYARASSHVVAPVRLRLKRPGKIGEQTHLPSIKKAVEKYLADADARHLAPETVRKRRELLEGKLLPSAPIAGTGSSGT